MGTKNNKNTSVMTFADFKHEEVNTVFGLTQLFEDEGLLTEWFNDTKGIGIDDFEKQLLANLRHKLVRYGKNWSQ